MIVSMTRLRIAVPRTRWGELLRFVARERLLHPTDPTVDPYFGAMGEKNITHSPASDHLAMAEKLRSMVEEGLNGLPPGQGERLVCSYPGDDGARWLASPLRERLEGVAGSVLKSVRAVARAQGELAEVASYLRLFMTFMPLLRTIGASHDMEAIGVVFHRGEEESARNLSEALERVTDGAGVVLTASETDYEGGAALLIFPRSLLGAVRGLAHESGVSPMKVPERYEEETFATTVARLYDVRADLAARIERERERLAMKSARWGAFLAEASAGLTRALTPLRAERYLLHDGELCWLTGWAPTERLPSFAGALNTTLDGAVIIQELASHPTPPTEAPVLLRNPAWAASFEQALALYALPRYGAFDPTTLAAFMFLIYFGMTLGDVGYGALLLGVTLWAKRRWNGRPTVIKAARFGAAAATVSIFFGGLYGEMFGPLWGAFGLPGPLFDRQAWRRRLAGGDVSHRRDSGRRRHTPWRPERLSSRRTTGRVRPTGRLPLGRGDAHGWVAHLCRSFHRAGGGVGGRRFRGEAFRLPSDHQSDGGSTVVVECLESRPADGPWHRSGDARRSGARNGPYAGVDTSRRSVGRDLPPPQFCHRRGRANDSRRAVVVCRVLRTVL